MMDRVRVLVVDDCGFNIMAVMNVLSQFGFSCDTCNDGLEAIDLVKARYNNGKSTGANDMYEAIMMDYSMPQCNGVQATIEIREFLAQVGSPQPYICCLTAYSEQEYKDAAKEAGMNNLLTKPINYLAMQDVLIKAGLIKK